MVVTAIITFRNTNMSVKVMSCLTMQDCAGQEACPDKNEDEDHLQELACQLAQQLPQQLKHAAFEQMYARDLFLKVLFV